MRYFVKQPDDLWSIYSDLGDDYLIIDATLEELYDYRIKESTEIVRQEIDSLLTDKPLVNVANYKDIESSINHKLEKFIEFFDEINTKEITLETLKEYAGDVFKDEHRMTALLSKLCSKYNIPLNVKCVTDVI